MKEAEAIPVTNTGEYFIRQMGNPVIIDQSELDALKSRLAEAERMLVVHANNAHYYQQRAERKQEVIRNVAKWCARQGILTPTKEVWSIIEGEL